MHVNRKRVVRLRFHAMIYLFVPWGTPWFFVARPAHGLQLVATVNPMPSNNFNRNGRLSSGAAIRLWWVGPLRPGSHVQSSRRRTLNSPPTLENNRTSRHRGFGEILATPKMEPLQSLEESAKRPAVSTMWWGEVSMSSQGASCRCFAKV